MAEWKLVITEVSTYMVELDTSNLEEARKKITAMIASGEIDTTDPDIYCNDEEIYPV